MLRESGRLDVVADRARADVAVADTNLDLEGPPLVFLTDNPRPVLRDGVRALLPRQTSSGELVAAVESVAQGLIVVHPSFAAGLAREPQPLEIGEPLTAREEQVLRLMASGSANKEIAWQLGISEHTVKFHVGSVLDKLNAQSRTEAVARGIRSGLIVV